jgi:PEP-CTERM motif
MLRQSSLKQHNVVGGRSAPIILLLTPVRIFGKSLGMQTRLRIFRLPMYVLAVVPLTSHGVLVWTVGIDDQDWPLGDGGGANASFVQENGAISPLPGSPTSTEVPQGADNDYYFAGSYTTVIASNGAYAPVGAVAVNEEAAERAFAAADNDLRYHFNLPTSLDANSVLSITYDALNLDDPNATNTDPRYGIELYFNNVLVQPQNIIRPAQIDVDFTSAEFSLASVNAQTGPGFDNIVSLRGINYNAQGGGNWMGIDYVRLDSRQIPEPSTALMFLLGATGLIPFFRRRRR